VSKRALILGVGGQDGSYLAELLLGKGYEVHGLYRRSSVDNLARLRAAGVLGRVVLHPGDVTDYESVDMAVCSCSPDEAYNLADQDDARWSETVPLYSVQATAGGAANVLRAAENYGAGRVRVFQPVSALIFGDAPAPQDVTTPLNPMTPYACAKAHALHLCRYYRVVHGMFVACGIMYNHDSPRRGPGYLLQKIARGVEIDGDLSRPVAIGYAPEFVDAAWRMLQRPLDLCVGSGRSYTVSSLVRYAAHGTIYGDEGPTRDDGRWLVPDVRPAQRALGWRAETDALGTLQHIMGAKS
jgi:GDPmannose 4,6-dehydratase